MLRKENRVEGKAVFRILERQGQGQGQGRGREGRKRQREDQALNSAKLRMGSHLKTETVF